MKDFMPVVGSILIAVAIAFVGYTANSTYREFKTQELENQVRFQCSQSSRYQTTDAKTGVVVWYPVAEMYAKCLSEQGIK